MKRLEINNIKLGLTLLVVFIIMGCEETSRTKNAITETARINEVINLKNYQLTQLSSTKVDNTKELLIIDFWATWCAPCIAAFPKLNDIQEKYKNTIQIIAVNNEDETKTKSFLKNKNFSFAFYLDHKKELFQKFDIQSLPVTIILDKKGTFIWSGNSDNLEGIIRSYKNNHKIDQDLIAETSPFATKYYAESPTKTKEPKFEYYITNSAPNDQYFARSQKNHNAPINIKYEAVPVIDVIHDLKDITYTRISNKRKELDTITMNLLARSKYKNITYANFSKRIISDLEAIYAIKISDQKEVREAFLLHIDNAKQLELHKEDSKGGGMAKIKDGKLIIKRLTLRQLASYLESKTMQPFKTNTNDTSKYNFEFDAKVIKNHELLKGSLGAYGIRVSTSKEEINFLLIQ